MYTLSGASEAETGLFDMTFLVDKIRLYNAMQCNKRKYQSVSSMATYIAPRANMTWNQEYYTL
jgi:hypothetical protein